ncbi:uncharacterized protein A1O9_00551 [Exophiala aquamarina CBS 119918]|uniref:F-box domain-containing protein n=1 Tax=Exophiala aquamarina CBS 119918 TaxID=1182545 RepID=A0A072PTA0_9EURO|nr:uncharacterized protein A1O9_00551 [Exophiala aquamarina CBS 119918]KEF62578.1 hypothetical protein A1O9_00551 [Exophiala aquamarina CBS 119918]
MTFPAAPYEQESAFLQLPTETRLHIYSYILPRKTLDIDLCTIQRPTQNYFPSIRRHRASIGKLSPISSLVSQVLELENITRRNGLHLLSVSRRTRDELRPLLSALLVRFHCPKCFEDLLANLSHGLGVGVASWMRHVEIRFDCGNGLFVPGTRHAPHYSRGGTPSLARFMASEAMQAVQRSAWLYYGRLDLMGREKWKLMRAETKDSSDSAVQFSLGQPQESHRGWIISGWFDI